MLVQLASEIYVESTRVLAVTENASNNALVTIESQAYTLEYEIVGKSAREVWELLNGK
jgi:hypothetical protein